MAYYGNLSPDSTPLDVAEQIILETRGELATLEGMEQSRLQRGAMDEAIGVTHGINRLRHLISAMREIAKAVTP